MRNLFLATTAFIALAATGTAHAASGNRFLPANLTPPQIAAKVPAALKADRTGHYSIMDGECQRDANACGTPDMYVKMFAAASEYTSVPISVNGQPLSLANLADFFGLLVEVTPPAGTEYLMACVKDGPNGKYAEARCVHRTFEPGEKAYAYKYVTADGTTKYLIVLAGNCKNPVIGEFEITVTASPCAEKYVDTHDGDKLRYVIAVSAGGHVEDPHHCLGVKFPGDASFHEFRKDCPEFRCDSNKNDLEHADEAHLTLTEYAGNGVSTGGYVIFRVPNNFTNPDNPSHPAFIDCLKRATDGMWAKAKLISARNYVKGKAYLYYQGEEQPEHPGVDWHW